MPLSLCGFRETLELCNLQFMGRFKWITDNSEGFNSNKKPLVVPPAFSAKRQDNMIFRFEKP